MAQQNEGWPLGLQPLNGRMELVRNGDNSGSMSFNTLLSGSPSSYATDSSSDLDTQSTGSFFPDKTTTLGSLMGVSSIVELSRRSIRGAKTQLFKRKKEKKINFSSWLFCLCSTSRNPEAESQKNNPPSLGQFLAVERRAANRNRKNQNTHIYGPDDELAEININAEPNSLFVNGTIAPPQSITPRESIETERESMELEHKNNGFGSLAELFSCMCVDKLPLANNS